MLRNFDGQVVFAFVDRRVGSKQRGVDFWQFCRIKRNADNWADDLNNVPPIEFGDISVAMVFSRVSGSYDV